MELTSMYYFNFINSIQSLHTKKKYMIKKPTQVILLFLLQNPHLTTNCTAWGGYTKNILQVVPILYKQPKKVNNFIFVTQNLRWQIKFKKPSKK